MLKPANLRKIASNIESESIKHYLKDLGVLSIRERELQGIERLVRHFMDEEVSLKFFYIGYSMPKISKEFDLLAFDQMHRVINIELKSQADYDEEKVKKQLINNKYYLSQVAKDIKLFTYNSDSDIIYTLTEQDELETTDISSTHLFFASEFYRFLSTFGSIDVGNLDSLFRVSLYLVSPFRETQAFLEGDYLLTQQQQALQNNILTMSESGFYAVNVPSGNGKVLMLYDTVKKLSKNNTVLIVHVGKLNATQFSLRRNYGWKIIPIRQFMKKIKSKKLRNFDYLFIDEAQNLSIKNINTLINYFEMRPTMLFLIGVTNSKAKKFIDGNYSFLTIG
ncbi:hypothetical protein [Leuconostoc suionicum]|uniref:hypothetical protein n=1 Tax=Leuconostoc suionicum TaxID=1511761 RepID=UPI00233F5F3D|nr:hypothetical protein [Leuconostoc suionicum]MDC2806430.1 hypothetical protein [Leuconostoc suionicum]MDC2823942.1 hypothetical protein [Leuconostoc suionicum]